MDKEIAEIIDALPERQKDSPGKRLRILRKYCRSGSQAELAQALANRGASVQHSTVSRLENDDIQPSLDTLEAIADEFGVSLDWLRCRSDKILASSDICELPDDIRKPIEQLIVGILGESRSHVDRL